jgi:di/tricarboxylate transporter
MAGKMNTDADRARRAMYGSMRGRDLYWGITLGIFSNLFTLYLISQGSDLPQLAISAAVVGTFIFVMVNSFDCMDDFKANADDMDDQEAATNFGKKFLEAPWTMFKGLVFLIFGAMAVTQLMEIW